MTASAKVPGESIRDKVEREIRDARQLLEMPPVRLDVVPKPHNRRMLEVFPGRRDDSKRGFYVLHRVANALGLPCCGFLDHWGAATYWDEDQLVMEPYITDSTFRSAELFAAELDFRLTVSTASWWFPGRTISLIFSIRQPGEVEVHRKLRPSRGGDLAHEPAGVCSRMDWIKAGRS